MNRVLERSEIERELEALPGWAFTDQMLKRDVDAPDFPTAIRIVDSIAAVAEEMDHHPDIDIRWCTLRFALSTHSAGGVTSLDFDLAQHISRITDQQIG